MQKWEIALNKFLERYIHEPWFEGALLCGSYTTGNQTEFSDIDVVIVGKNNMGWQEKSNCYVDGFLMEYTINPVYKLEEYMATYMKNHRHIDQNMFVYGKILHDKNGVMKKLRQKCVRDIKKPFKPYSEYTKSFIKYHLWDKYDELLSLDARGYHIDMQYWAVVDSLISAYYDFKNMPHPPRSKIEPILTDPEFAKRYHIHAMPPKTFTDKLLACMNAKSKTAKMDAVKAFYNYVMRVGGGFDIGKFRGYQKIEKR